MVLLAILALCVLIIVHEGGHFLVARLSGMRVDRFSVGFGPALFKLKRGETIYQIAAIPFGGFVQIAGLNPSDDGILADDPRAYGQRPVYQRLATIFAGPATNYVFAALMAVVLAATVGVPQEGKLPMVIELMDGKPAAKAGLQLGDEVVSIDGKKVKDLNDVAPIIDASQGREVSIVVLHEGEQKTFQVRPEKMGAKWRIGISIRPREIYVPVKWSAASAYGLAFPYYATRNFFHEIAERVKRDKDLDFTGPVGIVKQMKSQLARGPGDGLWMIAGISVLLGLFNLLPLPALDGGRMVFLAWEGIFRRRVNQRLEQTVHIVGMLSLLAFVIYITVWKDLGLSRVFLKQ